MKTLKAFLGGTCNGSKWREELIPLLHIDYFNPVVEDWTPECQEIEKIERETCDFVVYVITPKMKGVYSIAEAVQDSNVRPNKTMFCYLKTYDGCSFDEDQIKSLEATKELIIDNGANVFDTLQEVAVFLNVMDSLN